MKNDLPKNIKDEFQPFETIDPADQRYMAQPRFIPCPDNHLKDFPFVQTHKDEKGQEWLIRRYSPSRGFFDVLFCKKEK